MLNYKQILELIQRLEDSNALSEINIHQGDFELGLKKNVPTQIITEAQPVQQIASAPITAPSNTNIPVSEPAPTSSFKEIKSIIVGTFYSAPSPEAGDFVSVGSTVKAGDIVCIVEAMKVMNELPSEIEGEIVEVCVQNGDIVEFGTVLFKVK